MHKIFKMAISWTAILALTKPYIGAFISKPYIGVSEAAEIGGGR